MTLFDVDKRERFERLITEAKACRLCPRMSSSVRVIGHASGSIDAPIMFIGEAPGRLGADASAIPFHGDKAGENFEKLLSQVGLSRRDCFITNAALCNPKDDKGNNATPNRAELNNCSSFLKRQIDLVNPKIVVTLGAQALNAIKTIEPHTADLATSVRTKITWYNRSLIPFYHPGQRAMIHRSFLNQLADYHFLAETYSRISRRRSASNGKTSEDAAEIAREIVRQCTSVSYFGLHKLFYLAEYEYARRHNHRLTDTYIIRQKDGPYAIELHIKKIKKALPELEVWERRGKLMLGLGGEYTLFNAERPVKADARAVISNVVGRYGKLGDAELKRIVYLTSPMRAILREEKINSQNLLNAPIDFSSITSVPMSA